jgi:hypothetical protein
VAVVQKAPSSVKANKTCVSGHQDAAHAFSIQVARAYFSLCNAWRVEELGAHDRPRGDIAKYPGPCTHSSSTANADAASDDALGVETHVILYHGIFAAGIGADRYPLVDPNSCANSRAATDHDSGWVGEHDRAFKNSANADIASERG